MGKINKILSWPLVFPIKLYQKYISPHKQPSCRFTPTCSVYAVTALREWGPLFGLALAVWRVLRKGAPCECGGTRKSCGCGCGCCGADQSEK